MPTNKIKSWPELDKERLEYDRLYYRGNRLYGEYARFLGESLQTVFLMCLLSGKSEGISQKDICESLSVPKQTMSRVLRGLEERGIVLEKPSASDGREKLFSLTETGDSFAEDVVGRLSEVEAACTKAAGTEADLKRVNDYNRSYLDAFQRKVEGLEHNRRNA